MSWMELPDGSRMEPFGSGGGQKVADRLTPPSAHPSNYSVRSRSNPLLREGGDAGTPVVLAHPESASGSALRAVADQLAVRRRGLAGMSLGIDTTRRAEPGNLL